ncbi:hypothetical protein ABUL04_26850 [Micromonospora harpali]|uniref:Excreted virulence factor EspC, type VII ESX diderm n=2 Tax=Micromonospora TaxID=1873 RepID=A0A1C4X4X6_9ACTN|nr:MULTISPECIES: hypothetical protein [Micromonospora]OON32595.1 hypothetical protein BSA16_04790 [Micromonospora sp. Rc5]SCF03251.1 hypothetical protein GA0070558_121127 [Micromonospora haikouensis]
MANKVDVEAIRKAGRKLDAPDGPIQYLRNVQALLESVKLPSGSLTFLGGATVDAHNASVDGHLENVKTGVEHLHRAAEQLEQTAKNWEKSDQPWVVK